LGNERLVLLPPLQPFPACGYSACRSCGHERDNLGLVEMSARNYLSDQSGEPSGRDRKDRRENGDEPAN
jgi:hypothetical protein